ncbi:MAG: DUF4132 domain-containing protein [Phycisphaerae bacterium]|nr:DUF4132 domain-containing protein [Phycisphaerae bacterium]
MLSREQAEEALKGFQVADWLEQRRAAVRRLPGGGRYLEPVLLSQTGQWGVVYCKQTEAAWPGYCDRLHRMSAAHRRRLFEALFPRLVPQLESTWQLLARAPYLIGYPQRAFRYPDDRELATERRADWLARVTALLRGYDPDIRWVATWASYLGAYLTDVPIGFLLAGAMEGGGDDAREVFDLLRATATGEHETACMGQHVIRALLTASQPEGWEVLERLLLAAQREEGLRQAILETVSEAHPEAFRRMLRLILEHDLLRFSAVARAVDVWFGFAWDSASPEPLRKAAETVLGFLETPGSRWDALRADDAETAYLALWTMAFENTAEAITAASRMVTDPRLEHRFVAVHLLSMLGLSDAREALVPAFDDADLRVATHAVLGLHTDLADPMPETAFEAIERLIAKYPAQVQTLRPLVWPWASLTADARILAHALVNCLGSRPCSRLLPYLGRMAPNDRGTVALRLGRQKRWDGTTRETLLSLLGDASPNVRGDALLAVATMKVNEQEVLTVEKLLTRKPSDLRRGLLSLLLGRSDRRVLASAERLMGSTNELQRAGGLELLRQMVEANRSTQECRRRASRFTEDHPPHEEAERVHLEAILGRMGEGYFLENGLGLMDPEKLTPPLFPRRHELSLMTAAAAHCLCTLDALVHENGEAPITLEDGAGNTRTELLGSMRWGFPKVPVDVPVADAVQRLPLYEVWERWWTNRPEGHRDEDGLELLRALAFFHSGLEQAWSREHWKAGDHRCLADLFAVPASQEVPAKGLLKRIAGAVRTLSNACTDQLPALPRYEHVMQEVIQWLLRLHPPAGAAEFLVRAAETSLTYANEPLLTQISNSKWDWLWRDHSPFIAYTEVARGHRRLSPEAWTPEQMQRLWGLLRWTHRPGTELILSRVYDLDELVAMHEIGAATEADFIDWLVGPRPERQDRRFFDGLTQVTRRRMPPAITHAPRLQVLVAQCRRRILDIELARGETPTAASEPANALSSVPGAEMFVRLLVALGRITLLRGYPGDSTSKGAVFSHLLRASHPLETDTPEDVTAKLREARIPEKRLIEVAVYVPQWVRHIEHAVGWAGLAEGVWWMHAHTKDRLGHMGHEECEVWHGEVSQRTPLSREDLLDGAVDVDWFHRVWGELGTERWASLDHAAKYASSAGGHTRAQLFARAMLGQLDEQELLARISEKRHQDAVRALGLLPLPGGSARKQRLLERYRLMQKFRRTSRQFGSQRQASEGRAVEIAMQNLARTAGYPDPLRLEWAMEAEAVADLARGPVTAQVGEVQVALRLDEQGEPDITVIKAGKTLKTVPAGAKKDPVVARLSARRTELRRQASRMRTSLEQAMCRGDTFTGEELRELFNHPVLATMLQRLVLVGEGVIGYPVDAGQGLRDQRGHIEPVRKNEGLRIAHAHDLLATGCWHDWQRDCFNSERVQPFKQVFRELYLVTEVEKSDATASQRYAGHQVNPRQALALLGKRGWVSRPEIGVHRTFHELRLTAWLSFAEYFSTPAEVEGLTVESVCFAQRRDGRYLPLVDIPPRVFSEVMRDVDLIVSVAHRGGVDPEASASTVEVRGALVRETCALLKLGNVRVKEPHVLIAGTLGHYSVHLGSAVVHRQPGRMLCIVPVHAQHRGRLFLPFVDDDPRTAEVLSKTILLARDDKIRDPSILSQIQS